MVKFHCTNYIPNMNEYLNEKNIRNMVYHWCRHAVWSIIFCGITLRSVFITEWKAILEHYPLNECKTGILGIYKIPTIWGININ